MSEEIEVRELKTRDAFTLAKILLSLSDEAVGEITGLVSEEEYGEEGEEEEPSKQEEAQHGLQLAINVFQIILEHAEDDLLKWFADLTGMSKDDFQETRFDAPLIVVDEIIQQEGFQNFLSRASSLYSRMNLSAEQISEN